MGSGLNIIGDGALTASAVYSQGSGIGVESSGKHSDVNLNIGGNVTLNVTVGNSGSGRAIGGPYNGDIGTFSIGGNAIVNASSFGRGDWSDQGTMLYSSTATINGNPGSNGEFDYTKDNAPDYPDLKGQLEGRTLNEETGTAIWRRLVSTEGYVLDGNGSSISYTAAVYTNPVTINGVKTTSSDPLSTTASTAGRSYARAQRYSCSGRIRR